MVGSRPGHDRAWELTDHEEQFKDSEKKGVAIPIDLDLIEDIAN